MARILVIEDDPVVARVTELVLQRAGHRPVLARDFLSAKSALAEPADAVILDINLPGGNGLELLRHLREELGSRTAVLILSALKQEDVIVRGLKLGANDFLTKPFSPQELILRLERCL
ncbi:Phosphate regulon transcriptional regulatory protein PhoB [Calidithermus terrae]|uniref:Phosphate regulon transcriptional regulatory protein PhoB n=1 Tax=Calidithermus terrae TaxID=1408545 RepID=A0A399EBS1_9DEIN|nr:response regulator transcription factor [Calidithermus terrae]RIH80943.1 Phosphate regulon transcriptional regulatory protein PhoB [Calidithermus terrae]